MRLVGGDSGAMSDRLKLDCVVSHKRKLGPGLEERTTIVQHARATAPSSSQNCAKTNARTHTTNNSRYFAGQTNRKTKGMLKNFTTIEAQTRMLAQMELLLPLAPAMHVLLSDSEAAAVARAAATVAGEQQQEQQQKQHAWHLSFFDNTRRTRRNSETESTCPFEGIGSTIV